MLFTQNKWKPPSLSELPTIGFDIELTHFGLEASISKIHFSKLIYYLTMEPKLTPQQRQPHNYRARDDVNMMVKNCARHLSVNNII